MPQLRKQADLPPRQRKTRAFHIVLSFLIPFVVILAALAGMQITPFGDKPLVISDANAFYINTLSYAGRLFRGLECAVYSFEKGLGGNMTGHLNGILLTPFSFLFSFSSVENYPIAFTFVSALSMSLCGLTMYLLLADIYGGKRSHLLFSTTYALIGFNVANVFQACFFMGPPVLPIMLLGLRRILKGRSPLIYILSLAYALLTSAYFGFVLCVASVLFFFAGLWLYQEELRGKMLRVFTHYALSSLLGGLLPAAVWLCGFLSLRGGRLEQTGLADFSLRENMPFLQIGAKLFTGANNTDELVDGLPNVYVGILPLALSILFFLSRSIDRRKKLAAGFLLGVYLLSFWIVAVNMLMHGGTVTNWFNYRYSYVFSLLLLLLAAALWEKLDEVSFAEMKKCLIGMLLVTALVFTQKYEFVHGGMAALDYLLLLIVFLAFRLHKKNPAANPRRVFEIIALLLVCVNLYLNYRICTKNILDWGGTLSEYQEVVLQVDPLVQGIKASDDSFFRMEVNRQLSQTAGNDPLLYGYDGVGHGGSNERNFVREGLNRLGVPWFDMRSFYADGVPAATDTLLGIKYVIAAEDLTEEKGYRNGTQFEKTQLFGEQEEYWDIYYNADALQPAMLSDPAIRSVETDLEDVFANLNAVWAALSGEDTPVFTEEEDITFTAHNLADPPVLTAQEAREITEYHDAAASGSGSSSVGTTEHMDEKAPEDSSYIEFRFTAAQDGPVYAYNRGALSDRSGSVDPVLTFVGNFKAGEEVVGYLPVNREYVHRVAMEELCGRFRAAYAETENLHALSEKVKSRPVSIRKESETHLTGSFTADTAQTLLFTIPFDEGWSCYVDGVRTELHMTLGVFMAADVPAGTHSYELRYVPSGMRAGLVISACALLLTVLYFPFGRKRIDAAFEKREAALAAAEAEAKAETDAGAEPDAGLPAEVETKENDPV